MSYAYVSSRRDYAQWSPLGIVCASRGTAADPFVSPAHPGVECVSRTMTVAHAGSRPYGSWPRSRPRALGDRGRLDQAFHSIRTLVAIPAVAYEPWDWLLASSHKSTSCTAGRLSLDGPGDAWHASGQRIAVNRRRLLTKPCERSLSCKPSDETDVTPELHE